MRKVRWIQLVVASAFVATFLFADVASAQCCGRGWGRCWGRRAAPVYRCAPTRRACSSGYYSGTCSGGSCSVPASGTCSGGSCSVPTSGTCSGGSCSVPTSATCSGGSRSVPTSGDGGSDACGFYRAPTAGRLYVSQTRAESTESTAETGSIESRLVAAANAVRSRYGRPPLQFSAEITQGATEHSLLMARYRSCFHWNSPLPEICAAWQETPEFAVDCWLTSTVGHREELLNPNYRLAGVGVATDANGYKYWTMRFR